MPSSALFRNVIFILAGCSISIACSAAIVLGAPAVPASTPVNAMWSYDNAVFVMWLYGGKSSCPETRRDTNSALLIAPGSPPSDKEWKYIIPAEMMLCLRNTRGKKAVICESGELIFEYFENEKEYRGRYEFELSDGTQEAGVFRAQYCPAGN